MSDLVLPPSADAYASELDDLLQLNMLPIAPLDEPGDDGDLTVPADLLDIFAACDAAGVGPESFTALLDGQLTSSLPRTLGAPGVLVDPVTGEVFEFYDRVALQLRDPKYRNAIANTSAGLFGHHSVTATTPADVVWRGVQAYHMDKHGWADVAYSFGVTHDGRIFIGRGWGIAGGHTAGYNSTSHAICFIGNTMTDQLSDKAKRAILCLRRLTEQRYGPQQFRPHQAVSATACGGTHYNAWIAAGLPDPGGVPTPPQPPAPQPPAPQPPAPPAPKPPAPPAPPAKVCKYREYKNQVLSTAMRKTYSRAVGEVQFLVNVALVDQKVWTKVDGFYGDDTARAVRLFQQNVNAIGFKLTVDGVFGPKTSQVLCFILQSRGIW